MKSSYVVILVAKNEAEFISSALDGLINQSIQPMRAVIVDDGSTDQTQEIIGRFVAHHNWMVSITLPGSQIYAYGQKIIQAFHHGAGLITDIAFDFLVKMDADIILPPNYFETLLRKFNTSGKLGIASGQTYYRDKSGDLLWEDAPLRHTFGPCKMYRKECYEEIGGLKPVLGWDHIDEVEARMKGWVTRSFPELKIIHLRKMGSRKGTIKGLVRHGKADYITGYHWLYFLLKSIYRIFSKPYIVGSIASAKGFYGSYLKKEKKVVSKEFQKFYRREQVDQLINTRFWKLYITKARTRLAK